MGRLSPRTLSSRSTPFILGHRRLTVRRRGRLRMAPRPRFRRSSFLPLAVITYCLSRMRSRRDGQHALIAALLRHFESGAVCGVRLSCLISNYGHRALHPKKVRPSCRPYSFEAEENHSVQRTQVGIRDGCCLLVNLVLWDQGTHESFSRGARAKTSGTTSCAFIQEYHSKGSPVQIGSLGEGVVAITFRQR